MLSILFNLPSQPSGLLAGWDDFRLTLAEYIGYGTDSTSWTTSQDAELSRRVQESYRYVLYPATIPGERIPHVWSFLEQVTTLTTAADDFDYTMPSDFGSMSGRFTFALGTGFLPVCLTSEQFIRESRAMTDRTKRPERFAVRWIAQTSGLNQRQEVIFYPTPDAVYVLTYKYAVLAGPLSKTNPYPLGGPRISQLMIEACKAIGEAVKNGGRGDQWSIFREELLAAIQMDKGTNFAPTVGMMRGAPSRGYGLRRAAESVSYYYGPGGVDGDGVAIADGTWLLEV